MTYELADFNPEDGHRYDCRSPSCNCAAMLYELAAHVVLDARDRAATAPGERRPVTLDRVAPFDLQIGLWGADWAGDVLEITAAIAEKPDYGTDGLGRALWDRDAAWLATVHRYHDGVEDPPPEHWCLPWVTEQRLADATIPT